VEIKGKKYRIGSWAKLYIEELLRGGYVHNPARYVEGKAFIKYVEKYYKSWGNALKHLKSAGYIVLCIR